MHYEDCIKYIYSFINIQGSNTKIANPKYSPNLKRMQIILDKLGYRQTFKVAHIAGTKGKGSTTFILSNMLMVSGYSVGRILSPHIIDFRERITIDNKWIEKNDVVDITISIKSIIENLSIEPTAFEIITAMALYYFYTKNVDYACVEVGLGGRLDSTNIVIPNISIITSISFDHMERLGHSLEDIATEKAGIIKNNTPCISAFQENSACLSIKKICKKNNSNCYFYKNDFDTQIIKNSIDMLEFIYREKSTNYNLNIKTSLVGNYQAENISLALFSYRILLGSKSNNYTNAILQCLANIKFDGRFSIISKNPSIIVDGAHNAYSIECLLSNSTKYFDTNIVLFFAPLKDKDIDGMCRQIKNYESHIDKVIITSSIFVEGLKESDSNELEHKMKTYNFNISIEQFNSFSNAIEYAIKYSAEKKLPLLITGSLYTVSNAISQIKQE